MATIPAIFPPIPPGCRAAARAALRRAGSALPGGVITAGLLGATPLSEAHLEQVPRLLGGLSQIALADPGRDAGFALWDRWVEVLRRRGVELALAASTAEAVRGADLVLVCAPGLAEPVRRSWLLPHAVLVVHHPVDRAWEVLGAVRRLPHPCGGEPAGAESGLIMIEVPVNGAAIPPR